MQKYNLTEIKNCS